MRFTKLVHLPVPVNIGLTTDHLHDDKYATYRLNMPAAVITAMMI